MDAVGQAEKEFGAEIVVIKKTTQEYGRAKYPPPCPSVSVNGRLCAKCLPDQPKEEGEAVMKKMEEMKLPTVEELFFMLIAEGGTFLACPLNVSSFQYIKTAADRWGEVG